MDGSVNINISLVVLILCIIACIALVFLVVVLNKISKLIENIDTLVKQNSSNIGLTIAKLPLIAEKVDSTVDNAKDITDVGVEVAEDVLKAEEKIKTGISTSVDVAKIIKNVITK